MLYFLTSKCRQRKIGIAFFEIYVVLHILLSVSFFPRFEVTNDRLRLNMHGKPRYFSFQLGQPFSNFATRGRENNLGNRHNCDENRTPLNQTVVYQVPN